MVPVLNVAPWAKVEDYNEYSRDIVYFCFRCFLGFICTFEEC